MPVLELPVNTYSASKPWPSTTMRGESSFKVRPLDHDLPPLGFSVLDTGAPLARRLFRRLII